MYKRQSEYWSKQLPEEASYALMDTPAETGNLFDLLVIDEAQDILSPAYLEFLDLCLVGGLQTGRWLMSVSYTHLDVYKRQSPRCQTMLSGPC